MSGKIKTYKEFLNESFKQDLSPEQIDFLNEGVRGLANTSWKFNPETGLVDIQGHFLCYLKQSPGSPPFMGVKFGRVTQSFNCSRINLTSLEGAPTVVQGDFYCENNSLTSLEGAPQKVMGTFNCSNNLLTSLEGAPPEIGGSFLCGYNKLTSLKGAPKFNNSWDKQPNFLCSHNQLESLEGAPKKIEGYFSCAHNNLVNLVGGPEVVGKLVCSNNRLESLEGAPIQLGDLKSAGFSGNPIPEELLNRVNQSMNYYQCSYPRVVKNLWPNLSIEERSYLYLPSFDWVTPEESEMLIATKKYNKFKDFI